MKRTYALLGGMLILLTIVFACQHQGAMAEPKEAGVTRTEPSGFEVPEERKQAWENITAYLEQEFNVCIEHCGSDPSCEEKCQKVFNHRKEIEYNKFMRDSQKTN